MISNRLKTIASFVPNNSNVADIGSDHGYLLMQLFDNGHKGKLLGVENKSGPYKTLSSNVSTRNFSKVIETSLSDGLSSVSSDYNVVVIAGMGADNIKKIILNNREKLDGIDYFIVDSHTKTEEIRKFFCNLGYKIDKEELVFEDDIFYELIRFVKGFMNYSESDFYFGPELIKNKSQLFKNKWEDELSKMNQILNQISGDSTRKKEIESKIKMIKEVL